MTERPEASIEEHLSWLFTKQLRTNSDFLKILADLAAGRRVGSDTIDHARANLEDLSKHVLNLVEDLFRRDADDN